MIQSQNIQHRELLIILAISFLVTSIVACATLPQTVRHGILMKGSIIETYDSEIYLCIGKKDGAAVGQELDVYKVSVDIKPKTATKYTREKTGKIKITEIVDEHFAKAKIISGKAEKNYIVELEVP